MWDKMTLFEILTLASYLLGGIVAYVVKDKSDELKRQGILLNKTREEVARNHVTREEVHRDLERLMDRIDEGIHRLETKIDEIRRHDMQR